MTPIVLFFKRKLKFCCYVQNSIKNSIINLRRFGTIPKILIKNMSNIYIDICYHIIYNKYKKVNINFN